MTATPAGVPAEGAAKPHAGLTKRVSKDVGWTAGIHALSMITDLAFVAILARLLTPQDYGVMAVAMVFVALCHLFRDVGIGPSLVQLPNLTELDQRTALTVVIAYSLVLFALAQFVIQPFADFMQMPAAGQVMRVLSVMILIQAVAAVAQGLLLRDLRGRRVVIVEFLARLVAYATLGLALALAGYGYWALAGATLATAVLEAIGLVAAARPPFKPALAKASARRLLTSGSGFTVSKMINFIALRGDTVVVGRYLDAASLGLYSRAYRLMSVPTEAYLKVADRLVFPAYAQVQNEPKRLRSAFLKGLSLTALVGLPMVPALFILAPDIVMVMLGEQWDEVVPIFVAFSAAAYFRLGGRVGSSLLAATGAFRALIISQIVYAVLVVGGSLFAYRYGIVAVALAVSAAICAWFFMRIHEAGKICGASTRDLLAAHRHGAVLAVVTALALSATVLPLRQMDHSSFVCLAAAGLVLGLLAAALAAWRPTSVIGVDGKAFTELYLAGVAGLVRRKTGWPRARPV